MRCRRVRSFLSAYCNDEITGRRQLALREHLSTCSACRREEAFYRSVKQAGERMTNLSVSADFNTRLLDRIARERFSETRSRAYLPHHAPRVRWNRVVPAMAAATVLLLAAVTWLVPGTQNQTVDFATSGTSLDDLYKTVQPINNPNVTAPLHEGWSLDKQLQQTDRLARISNSITNRSGFGNLHLTSGFNRWSERPGYRIPYALDYYRIQSVIRIYQSSGSADSREDEKVY